MQDRYVGDVGDFGKYGLLRTLCGFQDCLRLGLIWYRVPNETHNEDGKYTRYLLERGSEFRDCDPELYDGLKTLLVDRRGELIQVNRAVEMIERSHLLPQNTIFYGDEISYRRNQEKVPVMERDSLRDAWFARALEKTLPAEIVFLDPDNGIQCRSVGRHCLKAPKYVFWDEIDSLADRGQSIIIYHHCNRSCPSHDQVTQLLDKFCERLPGYKAYALIYKRGTRRAYFVGAAPQHHEILVKRVSKMCTGSWAAHFIAC